MASLLRFGRKKKSSEQLVKSVRELLGVIAEADADPKLKEKAEEDIANDLGAMKTIFYGDDKKQPKEEKYHKLAEQILESELMYPLLMNLHLLPFETRKHVAMIFNCLTRNNLAGFVDGFLLAEKHRPLLNHLIRGYGVRGVELSCGSMVRELLRFEELARVLLEAGALSLLLDEYVLLPDFDVASDAFATVRELLTRHKALVASFLLPEAGNYDAIMLRYTRLLQSDNYVVKRQALKLLGELLLDRTNFHIMMHFIQDKQNLKLAMNLLRSTSPSIQFEAFHVFKVFVANPKKPDAIAALLYANRERLVAYLEQFQAEKDDAQFSEERTLLVSTLRKMKEPESLAALRAPADGGTPDGAAATPTDPGTEAATAPAPAPAAAAAPAPAPPVADAALEEETKG